MKNQFFIPVFLLLAGCAGGSYQLYQEDGLMARITDIRTGKHELRVVDVMIENNSDKTVDVSTVAMDNNGIMYMAFDKKTYDASGDNTTVGLREVLLEPGNSHALVWIPFTRPEEGTHADPSQFFMNVEMDTLKKSIVLQ